MSLKSKIAKLSLYLNHHLSVMRHAVFNPEVKKQRKNPKLIPIIIINFNQLFYLKQLVDGLLHRGYQNIVIVDNNSTYKPLLKFYNSVEEKIKIYRLKTNDGHLSFWKQKDLVAKYTKGYYVISDPDIVPIKECPDNFLKTFINLLDKAYDRTKVGFSLKIDDIPNHNPQAEIIKKWEAQFWKTKINTKAYKAEIDTTFALYRPNYKYKKQNFTKAWRTDFPIQAIHGGWYINPGHLTDEQKYYRETANESASWLLAQSGNLKSEFHNKIYTDENK